MTKRLIDVLGKLIWERPHHFSCISGVCVQQSFVHPGDSQIAGEALQLLVTCLQLRSNNMSLFYNLPMVNDFVIDTVLGSPSEIVRRRACAEFQRLSRIRSVEKYHWGLY